MGDPKRALDARVKAVVLEGGGEFAKQVREIESAEEIDAANRFWLDESVKAKETGEIGSTGQKQTVGLPAITIALRAATVKDRDATLYWLEKALAEGDATLSRIRYLEKFDFVRNEVRFRSIVNKLKV